MRHPLLRVLAHRPLRRLVLGSFVSGVGDGLAIVAVPWLALRLGRDSGVADGLAVGAASAAAYASGLPLGLLVGLGRSRFDPRRVLLASCALHGIPLLLAAGLAAGGWLGLWGLVGLLALAGVMQPISISARRLLAAGLTEPDELPAVNALLSTQVSVAMFAVGPALGGLLTAAWGPEPVLALAALTFAPLALAVFTIPSGTGAPSAGRPDRGPQAPERAPASEARDATVPVASGLAILGRHPSLCGLLVLAVLIDLLYYPVDVALPVHVDTTLGGAGALGLVWTGFGVGSIAGSLVAGLVGRQSQRRLLVCSAAGWAVALGAFAAAPELGLAVTAFALGGLAWGPFNPVMYTVLQDRLTADEQQPVLTLWLTFSLGAAPLGLGAGGPLVAVFGARTTLWLSAGSTLILALLTALLLARPWNRRTDRRGRRHPELDAAA
jgi:MFS family permease